MSFAHFNEIYEICIGMLKKDRAEVNIRPNLKKRYVIKSRPVNHQPLFNDGEEENEAEKECEKRII
nr:hypothetical protein [uncultured Bacillus sp.]